MCIAIEFGQMGSVNENPQPEEVFAALNDLHSTLVRANASIQSVADSIKTVYVQRGANGLTGRVIGVKGSLVAQVKVDGNWRRANTKQAAALFRNALRLELVKPGEEVVGWDARNRAVKGTYCGCVGDRYEVCVSRDEHVFSEHMLPVAVAIETGAWAFRPNMLVAAYVDENWMVGRWQGYEDGRHSVRLIRGEIVTSDRAHTAAYAEEHGLVQD